MNPAEPGSSPGHGIALTFGLHVLALVIIGIVDGILREGFLLLIFGGFIGVTQLAYMLPAIAIASSMRKSGIVKGMLIATAGTFICNALCVGVVSLG